MLKEQHCQQRSSFNLGKISLASLQFLLLDSGLEHPFRLEHNFGVSEELQRFSFFAVTIDASLFDLFVVLEWSFVLGRWQNNEWACSGAKSRP